MGIPSSRRAASITSKTGSRAPEDALVRGRPAGAPRGLGDGLREHTVGRLGLRAQERVEVRDRAGSLDGQRLAQRTAVWDFTIFFAAIFGGLFAI